MLDPEGLALELTSPSGVALSLVPLTLSAEMEPPELSACGRILLDVLCGNSALSIRADESEEARRVLNARTGRLVAPPRAAGRVRHR